MKIIELEKTEENRIYNICAIKKSDNTAAIIMEYGVKNGKLIKRSKPILTGKNIGKKNETTSYEQAQSEVISIVKKKLDQNYEFIDKEYQKELGISNISKSILPMLANKFKSINSKEVYISPKLDGHRLIARSINNEIILTTRKGKIIEGLDHIRTGLKFLKETDIILDGEIYVHGILTFQELCSAIKKEGTNTNLLKYYIYDVVDTKKDYSERLKMLKNISSEYIKICPAFKIHSKDIDKYHAEFIKSGYEGSIIRVMPCMYRLDKRSNHMLKYKNFDDEEFEIIGHTKELMQDNNYGVIYEVRCNKYDVKFMVRPKGNMTARHKMLKNINNDIGKLLTVKFFGRSDDNVPRFPVGISLRDYE